MRSISCKYRQLYTHCYAARTSQNRIENRGRTLYKNRANIHRLSIASPDELSGTRKQVLSLALQYQIFYDYVILMEVYSRRFVAIKIKKSVVV